VPTQGQTKVTVNDSLRAVALVGLGEKTTVPDPKQGNSSVVGIGCDP
jgi:hypothetical protein